MKERERERERQRDKATKYKQGGTEGRKREFGDEKKCEKDHFYMRVC
jgi:hypothetical protein